MHKEVAFDTNSISLGTGAASSTWGNIGSAAEINATASGDVLPVAWHAPGAFADLLLTGARLGAGALPIAGLTRVTLLTRRLNSRASL